jgi:hypothetical protein
MPFPALPLSDAPEGGRVVMLSGLSVLATDDAVLARFAGTAVDGRDGDLAPEPLLANPAAPPVEKMDKPL